MPQQPQRRNNAMKLKRQVFSYPYIVWMLIFILVPMLLIVLFAFRV